MFSLSLSRIQCAYGSIARARAFTLRLPCLINMAEAKLVKDAKLLQNKSTRFYSGLSPPTINSDKYVMVDPIRFCELKENLKYNFSASQWVRE